MRKKPLYLIEFESRCVYFPPLKNFLTFLRNILYCFDVGLQNDNLFYVNNCFLKDINFFWSIMLTQNVTIVSGVQ